MAVSYTSQMEDAMWLDMLSSEEDSSFLPIIDFLNSSEFRSFGDGLSDLIYAKHPEKKNASALDILKSCCQENGVMIESIGSVNTLKNWFLKNGERPKKGNADRERMFALAFAMRLTIEETNNLFHKVFLDRAFNFRNPKECIYYYCLKNSLSMEKAKSIIQCIAFVGGKENDQTQYTAAISSEIDRSDELSLIQYINNHPHNFSIDSVSARNLRDKLISQAIADIKTECQYERFRDCSLFRRNNGTLTRQLKDISINEMFEHISGQSMDKRKGTSSIFKNALLPKEIKTSFPEAAIFNKKEPTADELRKMIIFLYSYYFWCRMQYKGFQKGISNDGIGFDDYVEELDHLLWSGGFGQLYPGNPHDWMYCYCATTDYPLDTFRELLGDVLENSQ